MTRDDFRNISNYCLRPTYTSLFVPHSHIRRLTHPLTPCYTHSHTHTHLLTYLVLKPPESITSRPRV